MLRPFMVYKNLYIILFPRFILRCFPIICRWEFLKRADIELVVYRLALSHMVYDIYKLAQILRGLVVFTRAEIPIKIFFAPQELVNLAGGYGCLI